MRTRKAIAKPLLQTQIDRIVIDQAADDSAWEEPVYVQPMPPTSLSLPAELAARAAFVAQLHRNTTVDEWLRQIIRERLDVEETIYREVKRELKPKQPRKHVVTQ